MTSNAATAGTSASAGPTASATPLVRLGATVAIIVVFVVELARNRNAAPCDRLGAIGGLAYLLKVVGLRG